MRNKAIFVCKTPFQIIVSIAIKQQHFFADNCDLIIVPEFKDAEEVSNRLSSIRVFDNVFVPHIEAGSSQMHLYYNLAPKYIVGKLIPELCKKRYYFLFTNGVSSDFDNALYCALDYPEPVFFDEGYSSYTNQFIEANKRISWKHKIIRNISVLLDNRRLIYKDAKKMYFFDPDLFVHEMPFEIVKIWNSDIPRDFINTVQYIFNTGSVIDEYQKRYIFFEECFSNDFNNNGDLPLISMITDTIGETNLMIKLHPRDKTNRFDKIGLTSNKTFTVPAEALITELEQKKCILITFSSGSVINYKFISKNNVPTVFLYKLMPDGFINMPDDRLEWFEKFIRKYGDSIYVPKSIEELQTIIRQFDQAE